MNALWDYFWPVFALSLLVGTIAGLIAFRRAGRPWALLAAGAVAMLGVAALWHGPLGGAERFVRAVEPVAKRTLVHYEMPHVEARLDGGPLTRQLMLTGAADEFQREEIVRILNGLEGVSQASWSKRSALPLIVEASVVGLLGFLVGALLAYGAVISRRDSSEEKW